MYFCPPTYFLDRQHTAIAGVFALLLLLGNSDRALGVESSLALTIPQDPPSIAIYQPTGVQTGNVTVPYVISDTDNSLVGLLAEYSVDTGSTWQAATVTGDTSDIAPANYDGSVAWASGTDLSGQDIYGIWLRITPRDSGGWGTADTTFIDIDNLSPQWIAAEGNSG
ncbi:MAG: hypothetical protein KAT18_09290, partial [Candidatus Latescibacteria bacterium]|nr:hypothetical protein [Candidatus Latescibacterota bacterium]